MGRRVASFLLAAAVLQGYVSAQQTPWGQCGGIGWTGPTTCASGTACVELNAYYSQCIPGGQASTTTSGGSTTSSTSTSSPSPQPTGGSGRMPYHGINIAGFDFGCTTDGTCITSRVYPPLKDYTQYNNNPDGVGQMKHFVADDGFNFFRMPTGWQFLVNNNLGGTLDPTNFAAYDKLVQAGLALGATVLIDIHNYARWNGGIIGQGGPTNAQFASLWQQIATKYKDQPKVWFGLMNEPHDVNIQTWGQTVQAVVTAIRNTGATNHITLPGNDWQAASAFISDGSAAALSAVKNPDGTTTNLIFDMHKYLDSDNSGTSTTCVTNNIDSAFAPLATWLRQNGRQAILSETGGGNTASCLQYMCQQVDFLDQNSDVFLGITSWAAGSFDSTYELAETPTLNGNTWTDTSLVKTCLVR